MRRFLTARRVAEYLGLTPGRFRRISVRLSHAKPGLRTRYFYRDHLGWLEEFLAHATPQAEARFQARMPQHDFWGRGAVRLYRDLWSAGLFMVVCQCVTEALKAVS
jgi:hypothetical protein